MKDESIGGSSPNPFGENDAAEFTRHLEQRAVREVTGLDKNAIERIPLLSDGVIRATGTFDDVHHAPTTMPTHLDDSATMRWSAPDAGDAHEDAVNELAQGGPVSEDFEFDRPAFAQNLADLTGATVLHQRQVYEPGPAPADPATFDLFEPHTPAPGIPPLARDLMRDRLLGDEATGPELRWSYRGAIRTDLAGHPWHVHDRIMASNLEMRTLEAHLVEALVNLREAMAARGMTDGRLAPPFPGGPGRA